MSLKKLSSFQKFDSEAFFAGKKFLFTKIEAWQEGEDAEHLQTIGSKITGVIFSDSTNYGDNFQSINQGESITFKVSKPLASFENWKPFATQFVAEKFTKVTIYGEYRNQLSVKVPSLTVISN